MSYMHKDRMNSSNAEKISLLTGFTRRLSGAMWNMLEALLRPLAPFIHGHPTLLRTARLIKKLCLGPAPEVTLVADARQKALAVEPIPLVRYEEQHDTINCVPDVKLIAYHLPQFHPFVENDAWWGKGFTEWTNVRRGTPFFDGHIQPLVPHSSVGYYELGPELLRKQIALAKQHGIFGFCFHHYWFSGKRLMERPVDALLAHPDIDLPFCLNWANENWTRRWDGLDQEILIAQNYSAEDDCAFMRDLQRYFKDPRYIRINGRPVLLIYLAQALPDPLQSVRRWRQVCEESGEQEPFLVMVQSFYPSFDPRSYFFDAIAQFPPHGLQEKVTIQGIKEGFEGSFFSYSQLMHSLIDCWTDDYTLFPGVVPAWDNTARRMNKGRIFTGSSPELYEQWLKNSCNFVREAYPSHLRYVFLNAWNEWAEGAHLEPSQAAGYSYLNATTRALRP